MTAAQKKSVSLSYRIKEAVVSTSLLASGVAFEMVSARSPEFQAELSDWEEGRVFSMGVLPDGPAIAVRKEAGRLRYLGRGHHGSKLRIMFKNVDCALMALTGQIAAYTAFAQHRAIVQGSINQAMQANRAMAMVQKFLMPGIFMKKLAKRPPRMSAADLVLKARVFATLTPALVMNARK